MTAPPAGRRLVELGGAGGKLTLGPGASVSASLRADSVQTALSQPYYRP